MLVIEREVGEGFVIEVDGWEIRVVVTEARGKRVRIGIDAPAEVRVLRDDAKKRP